MQYKIAIVTTFFFKLATAFTMATRNEKQITYKHIWSHSVLCVHVTQFSCTPFQLKTYNIKHFILLLKDNLNFKKTK